MSIFVSAKNDTVENEIALGIGVPGIYVGSDPGGINENAKHGNLSLNFGGAWIKSISITTGMAPIAKYNPSYSLG